MLERLAHCVFLLVLSSVQGVCTSVQTGGHLEGFDELSSAHTAGTLGDDAGETHLPLQVDLHTNRKSEEMSTCLTCCWTHRFGFEADLYTTWST